jgi:hypothetical protein
LFLTGVPDAGEAESLAQDFACLGTLGTGGCKWNQGLAAARKALTVHAAGANSGFLRDDSLLAIMLVTDSDDCSIRTDVENAGDIFNTQLELGPVELRCYNHADQYVEPVESLADDLLALRPCPRDLAVAAVVGVPPPSQSDCAFGEVAEADLQCVLDLPGMQEVVDNSAEGRGERLAPSCDQPGLGEAFPPRRIVRFLSEMRAGGAITGLLSLCDPGLSMGDLTPMLREALQPR